MAKKKQQNQKKSKAIKLKRMLALLTLIPIIVVAMILGVSILKSSSNEYKKTVHNALVTTVSQIGNSFDYASSKNEEAVTSFAEAPIVTQFLKNPDDKDLAASAQEYTLNYFAKQDGWEAVYIATWDSLVLTHPVESVIGITTREGDSLKGLQDSMLKSNGVYNTGILTSPASGNLVMSLYSPVFDENNDPIGFIGAATYVNNVADNLSDVTSLGFDSAYVYFVGKDGTMLSHPEAEKIGQPVENEAVKSLLAKIEAGEHPAPEVIEYAYKNTSKYAAYYIGEGENYIAVLTADESDVLSGHKRVKDSSFIVFVICAIVFSAITAFIARTIARPFTKIAEALEIIGKGDLSFECKANSTIDETNKIIDSVNALREAMQGSLGNVKESALALNSAIIEVDNKTAGNVESVTQINDAINEVATTSQTVAKNAQMLAEKVIILGNDVENLNDNVSVLFDASKTIQNANNEATECMNSVFNGSKESVSAMDEITGKIAETNEAIERIANAIGSIEDIATQTNLLSLNASIEAARAGEAGKGFAVVADEIRSLADSSATSAKEIKSIIENITTLSSEMVDISNKVSNVISKEQNDIANTQDKFNMLSESVDASISEIDKIKTMTVSLDEIKGDMTSSVSELGAISEELGASAEEVAASCQIVTDACTDTQASTEEMRAINEHMSEAIAFFKF